MFQFDIDAARRVIDTKLEEPTLHLVQMISTLPVAFPGSLNTCGRITVHNSGRYVVVSNRGHDSIAVFSVLYESNPPGLLAVKTISHTRGSCPRHFAFDSSGMWLLAANQVCSLCEPFLLLTDSLCSGRTLIRLRCFNSTSVQGTLSTLEIATFCPRPILSVLWIHALHLQHHHCLHQDDKLTGDGQQSDFVHAPNTRV